MVFEKKKLDALRKLSEEDKSKKGSVDDKIRSILQVINNSTSYYTTSSCSGRIMVIDFPIAGKKWDVEWLLSSHDEVKFEIVEDAIRKGKHKTWFKIEAAILHIACKDTASAEKLLKLVRSIGYKRAGIISVSDSPIVEIIGTENLVCPVSENGTVLVKEDYLKTIVKEANFKLGENQKKLENLLKVLKEGL